MTKIIMNESLCGEIILTLRHIEDESNKDIGNTLYLNHEVCVCVLHLSLLNCCKFVMFRLQ